MPGEERNGYSPPLETVAPNGVPRIRGRCEAGYQVFTQSSARMVGLQIQTPRVLIVLARKRFGPLNSEIA